MQSRLEEAGRAQELVRRQYSDSRSPSGDEEEIDLLELWGVLKKRGRLILGVTLASMLVGGTSVFLMPPAFESRAVIRVGQIGQAGQGASLAPIERPQDLIQRLGQEYRVGERNPPNPLPRVEAVSAVDRSNPAGLVEIKAHARSPEQSQALLRKVTSDLLEQHRKLFASVVDVQWEERTKLAAAAAEIQEEAHRFTRELESRTTRPSALSALVLLEAARRQSELNALRSQIAQLDLLLSPANTYGTRVIVEPTLRGAPVKPKKALIIALAGTLGLFLAVFLALVGAGRSRAGSRSS